MIPATANLEKNKCENSIYEINLHFTPIILYLMPRREYFENNPIQKDDTAQSANAYMSLSGRNRRFSKHEIKTFFTSSIVFLNL